jgi:predicted transcriptional regulator
MATTQDTVADVIALLRHNGIDQVPVVDDDRVLLGMVSELELLNHMLSDEQPHSPDETIAGLINREVRTADSGAPLHEVLPELMSSKVVVLVDDQRRPEGILTIIDALEYLAPLEEHETLA